MTRNEHVTRAMLLGRRYDPMDHTYCNDYGHTSEDFMLDADTLEVTSRTRKWRERFRKENGFDEITMVYTVQAAHGGRIAWPSKGL